MLECPPNALVQLQAHYHHCGEAASEKCLSAATFVSRQGTCIRSLARENHFAAPEKTIAANRVHHANAIARSCDERPGGYRNGRSARCSTIADPWPNGIAFWNEERPNSFAAAADA